MAFDFTYPTPLPSTKGWGPGWPNCQREAMTSVAPFAFGVHKNIAELVRMLVAEMRARGFDFMVPGCWGYGCRGTKASSGSGTGTPSFHSWGLALDINAPRNVYGAPESTSEIATKERWVVPFLREYGFFWLGPAIKDWMHFSFVGSPADAVDMTVKATKNLGGDMTPEEKAKLNKLWNYLEALDEVAAPDAGMNATALGRRVGRAVKTVEAGALPPAGHEHNLQGKAT